MDLNLVLNELSVQSPAANIPTAQQRMSQFVLTLQAARKQKLKVLRTSSDMHLILLAPAYPLSRWLNDRRVDPEQRRFVLALATKQPFLVDIPEKHSDMQGIECRYNGVSATGFGVALLLEALRISILSAPCWDASHIALELTQLDSDGEIVHEQVTIVHASHPAHVQSHSEWVQTRLRQIAELEKRGVRSGIDLWQSREKIFPSLVFCECVREQVEVLLSGDARLPSIIRQLKELDTYAEAWQSEQGRFDTRCLPGTPAPESEATLHRYSVERTFMCPDGIARLFEWHLKLKGINWRIYFFPDEEQRVIIIGYIGSHLPTVKYRT